MKRCNACEEEFADKFSFCPVDGSPLDNLAAAPVGKEHRTSTSVARENKNHLYAGNPSLSSR